MDVLGLMKKRRSVRKYSSKKISKEVLYSILEAGRWAPCAGNIQDTRFVVVRDFKKKREIANACLEQEWIDEANALVVVCSESENVKKHYPKKGEIYSLQNAAAAIENMIITATAYGISSCWVGAFSENELRDILQIPEEVNISAVLTLGYSESVPLPTNRPEKNSIMFFEKWKNKYDKDFSPLNEKIKRKIKDTLKK